MRVAILGVGTVGAEVANVLIKNSDLIASRAGVSITPVVTNITKILAGVSFVLSIKI